MRAAFSSVTDVVSATNVRQSPRVSQVPTAPKDDTKTKAKPTPKPELKPTAKPEAKPEPKPEPKPEVLATARLEQRTSVQALEARVRTRAQTDGYAAAVAQQQKNDRALAQNLGPEKSRAIDQQVQSNLRDLSTPWGKDEALRKTKAQLDAAQSDPERMAVIERTVRTALPRDTTDTKDLRQRQEFVQSLARENQRDPKLRTMTQQTLLEEADLRLQKPGVAALTERPPRTTGDGSAASDLQNAQVLATSALSGGDPEQVRATVSSSTPERAERLGRLLTTPVEVPTTSSDGDSVRRRTLGNTLTALGTGDTDASTRAFTRSVATNIQRADVPSSGERLATHDDKGPVLDALAKAWGHQVSPADPQKAALHEKVLRRGLEHDATTPVKPEARSAYVQGLLDDPANFAFARPDAVGLGSDRALQKTVADETTARWTELSPEARREASSQLAAAFQTRQGRDLLLSSQLPAELRAQYLDVFRRDPAARTDLNGALQRQNQAVYEASGRSQHQTYGGKSLENAVGASLGLTPDASAARDPKALDQALGSQERSFYTEGQSGEVVGHLSKRIREVAGTDTPELRVIPVQFASATSGSQSTAVYGVKDTSGRETFVDHQGRTYASFEEWREQNKLPSGTYSYPDRFETGAGSRVVTADTPQTGKQEAWTAADLTVLGVGVASQLVQKIPHPVTIAAGTAGTGLALGYGAVRGGAGLHDQLQQGRSLNPITNPSTIPNYLDLASGVLPGVAQTTKSLAGLPAIARSPALTTALNNLGTGARALELSADAGQVGTALVNAAQNPGDPGALLNAALSSAFFAPRAFKTSQDLRQSLAKVPTPETPRQVTVDQPELGATRAVSSDPLADVTSAHDAKMAVLNSYHPNGSPRYKFLGSGSYAKVYEELAETGASTGRVIRLGGISPGADRSMRAAHRLGLGPEVYAVRPDLGYTTMEKVTGYAGRDVSLRLDDSQQVTAAREFTDKLGRYHREGWNHGDVWLDNMIYDPNTQALKLIDFDGARPQKILTSQASAATYQKDVADAYRRGVRFLKPESVDETTWFQQFKQDYLASLGGSEGRGRSPTVEARRRELALEVLDSLEAHPELRMVGHGRWR